MEFRYERKHGVILIGNNSKDAKMFRDRILTMITFVFYLVSKKTTKTSARFKFSMLMRLKKNKTIATKNCKSIRVGRCTIQFFKGRYIMKNR